MLRFVPSGGETPFAGGGHVRYPGVVRFGQLLLS